VNRSDPLDPLDPLDLGEQPERHPTPAAMAAPKAEPINVLRLKRAPAI